MCVLEFLVVKVEGDTLGDKIKALRKLKRMKQKEFSELINVSQQTVSKYEHNLFVPPLVTLKRIAEVLEINISDLVQTKEFQEENQKIENITDMKDLVQYLVDSNLVDKDNITKEIEKALMESVKKCFDNKLKLHQD